MRGVLLPLLLLAGSLGCGDTAGPGGDPLRVLFIGNSLTNFNNLPGVVEALSAAGPRRIEAGASLRDGTSLEDQWVSGNARATLAEGPWDVVVLQQGPSSLASSAANLLEWTIVWDGAIRAVGAVPALYAVWPEEARAHVFPDVSQNYRAAADAVDGIFLPAGDAWLAAWADDPALELYGTDRFHPSQLGTLLAALAIYGGLVGELPDLPAELHGAFPTITLPETTRTLLVRAAGTALNRR